jgi:predicted Zn-dependent protease
MRRDLHQWSGFTAQNWSQAAAYCAQNKVNLPEALTWAEFAVNGSPGYAPGEESFATLSTLSRLQSMNGKDQEAAKTFDKAINHPTATPLQIHFAARQLLTDGKKAEALKVFQMNAKRFPNQWPVHMGLMRGYSAVGDRKKAIEEGKLALPQAPNPQNKNAIEAMLKQLEAGKDIN